MLVLPCALCSYLHNRGIIHRDLKSPNLLVDEQWRVKVCMGHASGKAGSCTAEHSHCHMIVPSCLSTLTTVRVRLS